MLVLLCPMKYDVRLTQSSTQYLCPTTNFDDSLEWSVSWEITLQINLAMNTQQAVVVCGQTAEGPSNYSSCSCSRTVNLLLGYTSGLNLAADLGPVLGLFIMNWRFVLTFHKHMDRYEPSSHSTKELHGLLFMWHKPHLHHWKHFMRKRSI